MSGLAEVFVAVFSFLIEVTINLVVLAWAPLRYLFSRGYRARQGERWKGRPVRRAFEVLGSSVVMFLFAGMIWWRVTMFFAPEPPPTAMKQMEERLSRKIVEMLRRDS